MDKVEEIHAWIAEMMRDYSEAEPGETPEDLPEMPDVTPEEYREGMRQYLEEAGLTDDQIAEVLDQLEAQGDYTPDGYEQNIIFVIENNEETINNHVDNSITVEEGAEVHDIYQQNDTNQSNATGDNAIAGRDQDGQFQTGDGAQTGEGNSGAVFQGENSGQVAGNDAYADDITAEGGISVDGDVSNSGFGTGEGDVSVGVDQSANYTTTDSHNQDNTHNVNDSENVTDSENYDVTTTHDSSYTANADVAVEDSFQVNVEEAGYGHGHDDHVVDYGEDEGGSPLEEIKRLDDHVSAEADPYVPEEPEPYVPEEPVGYGDDSYEQPTYEEDPHCEPEEEPAEYVAE